MKPEELFKVLCNNSKEKDFNFKVKGKHFILGYLNENGKTKSLDLAKALDVSTARIAVIINDLEKEGLVVREKDEADKRITYISLTLQGTCVVTNDKKHILKVLDNVIKKTSKEDLAGFIKVLNVMKEEMSSHENNI